MSEELIHRQADVLDDLPEKDGREIAAGMKGYGSAASVRMPVLHMGSALTHIHKAHQFQYPDHLAGFEYRDIAHDYATTTF